jgi:hypothetical protein
VATVCSRPPAGRARWTFVLLAGELVRLTEHASISRETVRRRLAENDLKPCPKEMWRVPQVDAEYVARIHRRLPWRSFAAVKFATLEWIDWFNNCRLLEPSRQPKPRNAIMPV